MAVSASCPRFGVTSTRNASRRCATRRSCANARPLLPSLHRGRFLPRSLSLSSKRGFTTKAQRHRPKPADIRSEDVRTSALCALASGFELRWPSWCSSCLSGSMSAQRCLPADLCPEKRRDDRPHLILKDAVRALIGAGSAGESRIYLPRLLQLLASLVKPAQELGRLLQLA